MENWFKNLLIGVVTVGALLFLYLLSPASVTGRLLWNYHDYQLNKIDEATNYGLQKEVEDTCRSMQASYVQDKLMYEQYKESHPNWSEQAKIRANKTAASYNEYMRKNSFVWKKNIPDDIDSELEYLE